MALKYDLELSVEEEVVADTEADKDTEKVMAYLESLSPSEYGLKTYEGEVYVNYPQWMFDEGHLDGVNVKQKYIPKQRPRRPRRPAPDW